MNKNSYIGEMAEIFNLPISKLRYWESEGLVTFNRNEENNYRSWTMRTLRNLGDITFYRKLGIPIQELKRISNMNYEEIENVLIRQKEVLKNEIREKKKMLEHLEIKQKQIETIKDLTQSPYQFAAEELPAVRRFELLNRNNMMNLIKYEKDLLVMIPPNDPSDYRYGVYVTENYDEKELVRPKDQGPRLYLRALIRTSYELIEQNNLDQCYEFLKAHGYRPGMALGKTLVSAFDDELYNYYDAYIEAIPNE